MTKLLQEWITFQAQRQPEAVALVMGRESLTYGQIEEQSNCLARVLKEGGCLPGDRVCFLIPTR